MNFLQEATSRGFVHQCTDVDGLESLEKSMMPCIRAYIGFDCTANSLHVGSLMQLMILRLLQKHGHKFFVIMGDATTRIGDPTGKDTSRKMLADDEICNNRSGIIQCILKILPTMQSQDFVSNIEWIDRISYVDMLKEIGTHFTINRMLAMDSVKTRLERENPMTFLEFNYMILQSYDFMKLFQEPYNVSLQIGGSDQWGNITSGVDLIRRMLGKQAYGLTTPLIETASGAKMGKSESGAIWLTEDKTSVYDYWQFWRNTDDKDVIKFLRLFTDLSLYHINCLDMGNINEAKRLLANEATKICHGDDWQQKIRKASYMVSRSDLMLPLPAYKIFKETGLATSNADARRLIEGGGAKINNVIIGVDRFIMPNDFQDGIMKLSAGQKRQKFVSLTD